MKCQKHKTYHGQRMPTAKCEDCWAVYRSVHTPEEDVRQFLKGRRISFKEILRVLHLTADEFNQAVFTLRNNGVNVVYAKHDKTFFISSVPTVFHHSRPIDVPLRGKFGALSDTHLCSDAERLDLLGEAYDDFVRQGISVVLHCGDISDGSSVYRGQMNYVKVFGDMRQAMYVIKNYPKRDGIKTYFIAGNHDLDSLQESGTDRCSLIVNGFDYEKKHYEGRSDLVYLGQFSAVLIFPQEVRVVLIHPRGGNTYAYSYQQQKRSQNYAPDSRPDAEFSGHLHYFNHCFDLGTQLVALPGLQDETEFFVRLGLKRQLGYVIVEYEINNGRFVKFSPSIRMWF